MTSEEIRLACLQQAVRLCERGLVIPDTTTLVYKDPLALAKTFAGFVFGFEWDEDEGEYIEPEEDDSQLKGSVRAFDEDGQEL